MESLGFDAALRASIRNVLAAILHVGQIQPTAEKAHGKVSGVVWPEHPFANTVALRRVCFAARKKVKFASNAPIAAAATLLGIDEAALHSALTSRGTALRSLLLFFFVTMLVDATVAAAATTKNWTLAVAWCSRR